MMIFALIFAFAGGILVGFQFLLLNIPCGGCLESLAYAAAIACTSLVYVAFGSQFCVENAFDCSFGEGASYNVIALAAYCGAWIILCCSPKPSPLLSQCRKS